MKNHYKFMISLCMMLSILFSSFFGLVTWIDKKAQAATGQILEKDPTSGAITDITANFPSTANARGFGIVSQYVDKGNPPPGRHTSENFSWWYEWFYIIYNDGTVKYNYFERARKLFASPCCDDTFWTYNINGSDSFVQLAPNNKINTIRYENQGYTVTDDNRIFQKMAPNGGEITHMFSGPTAINWANTISLAIQYATGWHSDSGDQWEDVDFYSLNTNGTVTYNNGYGGITDVTAKFPPTAGANAIGIDPRNLNNMVAYFNRPPALEVGSPTSNQTLGSLDTSFVPIVRVSDWNGDNLNLSYYIDSESSPRDTKAISNTATPQLVSFNGININGLSEGIHTLKFIARDGTASADSAVNIFVDKSPPRLDSFNVTSSDTSIQITGAASDALSALDPNPYRFNVGGELSAWTGSTSYIRNYLSPNTAYYVSFEARDNLGQVAAGEQQIYTKAQIPALGARSVAETSVDISINDSNPANTLYQIIAGGQYVSQSGALTGSPEWITAASASKTIKVNGLIPNTSYTFQAKATNTSGVETSWSSPIQLQTLPSAPQNVTADVSQHWTRVNWQAIPGVTGYDVEADGVVLDNGPRSMFEHNGLAPATPHSYRVRAKNPSGAGSWSTIITPTTLPDPPPTPINLQTVPTQTEVSVTWDTSARAIGYELEVDGTIVNIGNSTSYVHRGLQPKTNHTYRIRANNMGGTSEWSAAIVQKTLPYPPKAPAQVVGKQLIHDVTLTWAETEEAEAYEVEADGLIIENGSATTYVHDGLEALSSHAYRVRAKNAGGRSPWSQPLNITTHPEKPITPGNVMITAEEKSITVMWYRVPHDESFDVEIDGATVANVTYNQFTHEGVSPDNKHSYRVRAKNISGDSPWSRPVTMMTLPTVTGTTYSLTNMVAVVTNRFITVSWDTVAPQAQYEIEVDGELRDNGKDTIYQHTGLKADEFHTYKIRLKNETGPGSWIAILSLSTLPDPPDAPTGVDAFATTNAIELRWQKVNGADGYDIEVDGKTMDAGGNTSYLHIPLPQGTTHSYRVRAKNTTGITAWSPSLIKSTTSPTYKVNAKTGQTFELSLLASNVQDFSEVMFVVTFDSSQLDVMDLYTFTPQPDTNSGKIPRSNLEATNGPGKLTYRIQQNIVPGTSWSGEVTTILFKSKVDAVAAIDVVVE